ncbi:RhoGAP domain protein [Opisthorchis viverrini]|uniref:RhoGAP domain protein n=1 Tax=Opisthorchis viverrini TaxID=6198 RepID=A0A1S8X3Z2_OPIVI|nr:RhoGAP domain protein [Opisthorchis viverrini]
MAIDCTSPFYVRKALHLATENLLHDRTEMSCWQGVNHGVRTSTSKPSWFSSCSCSSSAMTVSSVCCYRNTSRKMTTSTATDVAPGLSPKNGQIPPTDPDSGDDVCHIPQPVFSLFVYLAQQGGHVNDMFRRPGNITQMRQILQEFTSGNPVNWSDYNVYTVANVAKKLLLSIPDGLFGVRGEALLLSTASGSSCSTEVDELLDPVLSSRSVVAESHCSRLFPPGDQKTVTFADDLNPLGSVSSRLPRGSVIQLTQLSEVAERRIAVFLRVLESLPSSHRQFSILVFGLLHQLVMNATSSAASCSLSSLVDLSRSSGTLLPKREDAKDVGLAVAEVPLLVLAEGVVKSVAGALFHTCCSSIHLVEQAAQVLRTLVLFFPAMGDSVTRFFVEAVANRLPPRKTLATDSGRPVASRSFCVLCPETGKLPSFGDILRHFHFLSHIIGFCQSYTEHKFQSN